MQGVQSSAGAGADSQNGGAFEKRSGNQLRDFVAHQREHLLFDQISFGNYDQAVAHVEQAANVKVLSRLWHYSFIGGNHQRHEIDTVRAGEHVLDKALVSGNINKADAHIAKIKVGKAEIDCDAALLLFRQTIRIGAGQRAYQGALPVIDMSGRANDD